MKRIFRILIITAILVLAGCGSRDEQADKETETDRGYAVESQGETKKEEKDTTKETEQTQEEVGKEPVEDIIEDEDDKDDDIVMYYSDDKSVALKINYTDETAVIIDGNDKFPVEISMAPYGPYIEKCDVNDDGKDDYLIAECEGNGTGFCVYGLCILKNNGSDYDFYRYDGNFLSDLLKERISYSYDNDTGEVTFTIDNEKPLTYKKLTNKDYELQDVIWSDIIKIRFIDKKPYILAPSGYIYKDIPMPDYEGSLDVTALININSDLSVSLKDILPDKIPQEADDTE